MNLKIFLDQTKDRFNKISNEDPRAIVGTRDLIATLVFCFSRDRGNFRTLDCIRKFVQSTFNVAISRGGFWERLATKKLQHSQQPVV